MRSHNIIVKIACFIFVLLLMFVLPLAIYNMNQADINLRLNGKEVTATVINVEKWQIGKKHHEKVTVTYVNDNGQTITAEAYNSTGVFENDTIVGSVLPGKPEIVYVEPSIWIKAPLYGLAGLFFFGGFVMLVIMIRASKDEMQLTKQGKVAEAVIIRRELVEDAIFVDVGFRDHNGIQRFGNCRVPAYLDSDASICMIRYLVKSEKKVICEIV